MNSINFVVPFELDCTAMASSSLLDPNLAWIKFIFTDDKPNGNKQGIPREEFDNIIRTGLFKPVKGLSGDHEGSVPVGAIAQLEVEDDKVVGIASLWELEYPDFVASIRQAAAQGQKPQLSWEIVYRESEVDEQGVEWLRGCSARAITIVDNPAYAGRTPILAIAEQGDNMEENKLAETEAKLKELEEAKATLTEELLRAQKELEELRAFKQQVEAERARQELLNKRLTRFQEAGLNMTKEELEATFDKWASLDDEAFEFVLGLLVNSTPAAQAASASLPSSLPSNLSNREDSPEIILKELLTSRKVKE